MDASGDGAGELWWRYEPLETGKGAEERRFRSKNQLEGAGVAVAPQEMVLEQGSRSAKGDGGGVGSRAVEEAGKSAPGKYAVRVNCPIRVLDPKDGVYECHAEGKEAQTVSGLASTFFCSTRVVPYAWLLCRSLSTPPQHRDRGLRYLR